MNKTTIKKCNICETKLNVFLETFYNGRADGTRRRISLFSRDGVIFGNSWFCNQCWDILINNEKRKVYKHIKPRNNMKMINDKRGIK